MKLVKKVSSALLLGVMALLAIPGCEGEEPAPEPSPIAESAESAQELGCFMNLVPTMTGYTAPSGTVGSSGAYSSDYAPWQVFDRNPYTMWISPDGQANPSISYTWAQGRPRVNRYAFRYSNGNITTRAPKSWNLIGWNSLPEMPVLLDSRTNETGWAGHERREYKPASQYYYKYYAFVFLDDNDPSEGINVVSLGEVELMGCTDVGTPLWARIRGAPGAMTHGYDLTADPSGRSYSAGLTTGAASGPLVGGMDAFLNAYDTAGTVLWTRQLGVPERLTLAYGVARNRASTEVFMAGFTGGALPGATAMSLNDAFLTKYSSEGEWRWTRQLGTPSGGSEGYGVSVDAADNAFLVGGTYGSLDGNTRIGLGDAFVAKYDAAGNRQWTRTVGAAGKHTHARRAAADDAGNVYISGWTDGALDGNVKVGTQDFFITKYNAAGVKQWTRQVGAAGAATFLYGTALDAAGNVYVTGYSSGDMDGNPGGSGIQMYLAKYDPSGVKQWVRQLNSTQGSWGVGIDTDATGVYVGGSGAGDLLNPASASTAPHTFIAKYDLAGNLQYVSQQEPASINKVEKYGTAWGFGIDASGNAYLGGRTSGNLWGATLQGDEDSFVVKLRLP
ncbi:SBBP repeat-containing protein [Myxococcaceae bacterium GXIMD 01537]